MISVLVVFSLSHSRFRSAVTHLYAALDNTEVTVLRTSYAGACTGHGISRSIQCGTDEATVSPGSVPAAGVG
jgi:hypothetical protein